jgi:hypothetical protein
MELNHLIDLISQLPKNSILKYVRGDNTCTFVSVDKQENRVYAKTPEGKDFTFAPSFLSDLSQRIEPNVPFSTSQLLNNKGTNRAVIDSIIANTAEFYWINGDNRSKFTVWIPSSPHRVGELVEWKDMSVLETSSNVNSVSISLSTILFDDANKKHYSDKELIPILSQMYKDGEDDKSKSANLILFGLKYGESITNATQLCAEANIPLSTPVVDGVKLHKLIKMKKYGVAFFDESMNIHKNVIEPYKQISSPLSLQVIYYGAPGTGKSHAINTLTSTKSVVRTTFHPDSDYSTFVGAYKPTTEEQTRYNDSGVPVIYHDGDHKGEPIKDKVIVYDFVEQAFLKAYEEAWKKFFANPEAPEDEYLVIEEINRGNCAQIFGDLFQLLDRNKYGYSEYPITADNDISKHLKDVFAKAQLHLDDHSVINHMYNRGNGDVAQKVLDGNILLLPKNLYIWATMNTSDQSLFPIDSAFKRRWDWKYQPITRGMDAAGHDLNWRLEIDADHQYDWWSVISNINSKIIGKLTKSEDKKLGYFFCKASNGVIDKDIFVEKVLFYLWNEILKDFEPSQDFLKDETLKGENDGYLSYDLFYDTTSGKAKIIGDRVNHLLANLKIEPWEDKADKNDHTEQTVEETDSTQENISE